MSKKLSKSLGWYIFLAMILLGALKIWGLLDGLPWWVILIPLWFPVAIILAIITISILITFWD